MAVGLKTGGRQKGTPNKRTEQRDQAAQAAAQAIQDAIPDAFDGDAHALLMAIYKDPRQPMDLRIDCAKAALRFEKSPMPVATELSGPEGSPLNPPSLVINSVLPGLSGMLAAAHKHRQASSVVEERDSESYQHAPGRA